MNKLIKGEISFTWLEENGAEILASSGLNDNDISADFKAPQSLAPSPHMQTVNFSPWRLWINNVLCSGDILA